MRRRTIGFKFRAGPRCGAGPGHNWLPAPRDEAFYVVLRLYQPGQDHLAFHYRYPPLRRL